MLITTRLTTMIINQTQMAAVHQSWRFMSDPDPKAPSEDPNECIGPHSGTKAKVEEFCYELCKKQVMFLAF